MSGIGYPHFAGSYPGEVLCKDKLFFISCMYFYKNFFHNFDATGLASRASV
jgi:hypothetical protein